MIVPINEQYRIITDPYQWIVQKKRTRKDKDDWESVTYHPTFPSAVQSLGELMVRRSDAATLAKMHWWMWNTSPPRSPRHWHPSFLRL